MVRMGVYDQIKKAFQDIVAPEIHELRGEIWRLDQKIDGVALAREFKANEELRAIPMVGFFSHVETELQRNAQAAGFDQVLPRSVFARDLQRIISL